MPEKVLLFDVPQNGKTYKKLNLTDALSKVDDTILYLDSYSFNTVE